MSAVDDIVVAIADDLLRAWRDGNESVPVDFAERAKELTTRVGAIDYEWALVERQHDPGIEILAKHMLGDAWNQASEETRNAARQGADKLLDTIEEARRTVAWQ